MTKRDDYFKALGRVQTLLGVSKGLAGLTAIAAEPKFATMANTAATQLSMLYEQLAERSQQIEAPAPQATVKALVLPMAGSKEEFALAAMAEAMGLKITDVVVPTAQPKVEEPAKKITNTEVEQAVLKDFGSLSKEDQELHPEKVLGVIPAPEPSVEKSLVTPAQQEDISPKTGKPKRKYVKSGKFTADAVKARTEAWAKLSDDEKNAKRTAWLGKAPYKARRMS
jgi:hypothetical protein